MRQRLVIVLIGTLLLGFGLVPARGEDKGMEHNQMQMQEHKQMQTQEQVYGWQLMSEQERLEHRMRMQQMKTEEEREAYRHQHHEMMEERARKMGVTLPAEPAMRGKGMGTGGGGMGPGGGMGGGKR